MRDYNRYFKDHLRDELDSIKGIETSISIGNRFIPLEELKLPTSRNEYTFRDILETEEKLKSGEINEEVTINKTKMIVEGELIYLAAKRLRRVKISYKLVFPKDNNSSGFSVINNLN